MPTFEVTVTTGRRYYSDTRSAVWIELFDWHGHRSGRMLLGHAGEEFRYGHPRTFAIVVDDADCVGPVRAIEIAKGNEGRQPAWYLGDILLTDLADGTRYPFPFNQWFSGFSGLVHWRGVHGALDGRDVEFGLARQYDTGVQTSVAMNDNGDVAEIHKSEHNDRIWYRIGRTNQMDVR